VVNYQYNSNKDPKKDQAVGGVLLMHNSNTVSIYLGRVMTFWLNYPSATIIINTAVGFFGTETVQVILLRRTPASSP